MDALPLPPRPNLEQYRKRAKDLVRAYKSSDDAAFRTWATDWLVTLTTLRGSDDSRFVQDSINRTIDRIERHLRETRARLDGRSASFSLADAQQLIARAHGFASWPAFASHIDHLANAGAGDRTFEQAADAVITGDEATLASLLSLTPTLVHARSTREHHVTLLHYVAANGVEDFRQKTPANTVAIARMLLEAGAEPDALADTYGGDTYQTTMNLLVSSIHPAQAGLQANLVEMLLDFGAAINGLDDDGSPLMTALAFGYGDAAEALARRGARLATIITAAALGATDIVRTMVLEGGTLKPHVPLVAPRWMRMPPDPKAHVALAMVWACRFGRAAVVELFLAKGVAAAAADSDAMTALHWAAAYGHVAVVDLLLARGAPLEVKNRWGGTVLDSTVYFAIQEPVPGVDYVPVISRLIAAGADRSAVTPFPTGNPLIDKLLQQSPTTPGG